VGKREREGKREKKSKWVGRGLERAGQRERKVGAKRGSGRGREGERERQRGRRRERDLHQ
jgi:hypothetical protein